jgi:hypothetical protein
MNPRRRRRRVNARHRRRNPVRRRRRNPFDVGGIIKNVPVYVVGGVGGVSGYLAVQSLDSLYTFPLFQSTTIPGTTATVGDTIQSVLHATLITAADLLIPPSRSRLVNAFTRGAAVGAWVSVVMDLVKSISALPSSIQQALSGYPRGMGAIRPGSTYAPALTAGPVFNPGGRMMGYPAVLARGF